MAQASRLLLCVLFVLAVVSSARTTFLLSGEAKQWGDEMRGRALMGIWLNDYARESANGAHSPNKPIPKPVPKPKPKPVPKPAPKPKPRGRP